MSPVKRILIIDDEPNVRLMFRTALESAGHEVVESEGGEQGLRRLRRSQADLVLLDLQMPTIGGMEVLRHFQRREPGAPRHHQAYGKVPDAIKAMKLGAIDCLAKPITPNALRKVLVQVLERRKAASPGCPPRARDGLGEGTPGGALPEPRDRTATQAHFRRESATSQQALNQHDFREGDFLLPHCPRPR